MKTTQGEFPPNVPASFATRPWTWGYAGIGVDISRDGKTTIIGSLPTNKVTTQSYSYIPA